MGKVIHLEDTGEGNGGSGIGWQGQVEFRADLPITIGTPAIGDVYLVEKPTTIGIGILSYTTYQSGLYIKESDTGSLSDWRKLNVKVQFTDGEFKVVHVADTSKQLGFSLSDLTAGFKRVLSFFDEDYKVGQVHTLQEGANITIDSSDPNSPIINANVPSGSGPFYSYEFNQSALQQSTNSEAGVTYLTLVTPVDPTLLGKNFKAEFWFSISHEVQNTRAFIDIKDFGASILAQRYEVEPKDDDNRMWTGVVYGIQPNALGGGQFQLQIDFGTTDSDDTTTMYAAHLSLTRTDP